MPNTLNFCQQKLENISKSGHTGPSSNAVFVCLHLFPRYFNMLHFSFLVDSIISLPQNTEIFTSFLVCLCVYVLVNVPSYRSLCLQLLFTFFMGHHRPLFPLFSSFQTNMTIFTTNICENMCFQYTALGLEPMTFRT